MDLHLAGHTAVIVGAGRGLGAAIAQGFAAEGANLAVVDLDPSVRACSQQLQADHAIRAEAFVFDVVDYEATRRTAGEIGTTFGRVDHVVYAVGIGSGKFGFPFWNLDPGDWMRVVQVNLLGAVHIAQAFAPLLVAAGAGSVLLLSSVAGQIGSQTDPPYSAAKAGLINFGQCAAKDFASHGVRVNILCPGMVRTELNKSVWEAWHRQQPESAQRSYEDWAGEKVRAVVPLGRWQEPEDIAAMAVFLASDRARNITGQTINVDGGYVMHW